MKRIALITILSTIMISTFSCTCTNADCEENGIEITINFSEHGSSDIISLEGYTIAVTSFDNSIVIFKPVFSPIINNPSMLEQRGITFFARNAEKYTITLNEEISTDIEIETLILSEGDCCVNYGLKGAVIDGISRNCDEECMIFNNFVIRI